MYSSILANLTLFQPVGVVSGKKNVWLFYLSYYFAYLNANISGDGQRGSDNWALTITFLSGSFVIHAEKSCTHKFTEGLGRVITLYKLSMKVQHSFKLTVSFSGSNSKALVSAEGAI